MKNKKAKLSDDFAAGRIAGLREAMNLVSDAMQPMDPRYVLGLDKAVTLILKQIWEAEKTAIATPAGGEEGRSN